MKTLALFSDSKRPIPATTAWYLDSLGQFRGKQELYTRQSAQKLRILREHAIIESAVSSSWVWRVALAESPSEGVRCTTRSVPQAKTRGLWPARMAVRWRTPLRRRVDSPRRAEAHAPVLQNRVVLYNLPE
jgi:hypothetical protein